ncbi:uncharacterized protein [Argopecten irradians]|uniref:uncharacterized protein n=1 Tax=Argopecten irradians TaxID=31199 RepID=UPI00371232B5
MNAYRHGDAYSTPCMYPPDVTIAQTAFGAQVSTTITLGCTVTSDTTVTSVFWQRDIGSGTETITVDGINFSGSTPTVPSVTIINSDTTDSGTYQCFATNADGTGSSATATVTIVYSYDASQDTGDTSPVPTVTVAQSAYSTTTGTSVTLTCTVSSATTNLQVNYSGSSTSTPSLTVIAADSGDAGSYTCFAINSAGTGNSVATTLTVTGARLVGDSAAIGDFRKDGVTSQKVYIRVLKALAHGISWTAKDYPCDMPTMYDGSSRNTVSRVKLSPLYIAARHVPRYRVGTVDAHAI